MYVSNFVFLCCGSFLSFSTGAGHKLVIEFHAHREKLLQERLTVNSQDGSDKYRELYLHARVLGNTTLLFHGLTVTSGSRQGTFFNQKVLIFSLFLHKSMLWVW